MFTSDYVYLVIYTLEQRCVVSDQENNLLICHTHVATYNVKSMLLGSYSPRGRQCDNGGGGGGAFLRKAAKMGRLFFRGCQFLADHFLILSN